MTAALQPPPDSPLLHSDRARRFVDLCNKLTSNNPWTLLSQRVDIDNSLEVSLIRTWLLDSQALAPLMSPYSSRSGVEFIPVQPIERNKPSENDVAVVTPTRTRGVAPVPYNILKSLLPPGNEAWRSWLALPLAGAEFRGSPIVTLTSRRPYSLRPRLPQLLFPVTHVKASVSGALLSTELQLSCPAEATVDVVAVECWLDLSSELRAAREHIEQVEQTAASEGAEGAVYILRTYLDPIATNLDGRIRDLTEGLRADSTSRVGKARAGYALSAWYGDLVKLRDTIKEWKRSWEKDASDDLNAALSIARKLLLSMESPRFVYPTQVKNGVVDFASLTSKLRSYASLVRIESMIVPMTAEREPSTQGVRAASLLGLLGAVLLLLSSVDFAPTWLRGLGSLVGMRSLTRVEDLRDSLVAVLVIFPATLYAQFFQLKPRSFIGSKAQAGTFAAQSAAFALPVIPAAVLASGGGLADAALWCAGLGSATLALAVAVWLLFLDPFLAWLRQGEMIRTAKSRTKHASAAPPPSQASTTAAPGATVPRATTAVPPEVTVPGATTAVPPEVTVPGATTAAAPGATTREIGE